MAAPAVKITRRLFEEEEKEELLEIKWIEGALSQIDSAINKLNSVKQKAAIDQTSFTIIADALDNLRLAAGSLKRIEKIDERILLIAETIEKELHSRAMAATEKEKVWSELEKLDWQDAREAKGLKGTLENAIEGLTLFVEMLKAGTATYIGTTGLTKVYRPASDPAAQVLIRDVQFVATDLLWIGTRLRSAVESLKRLLKQEAAYIK